MVLTVRVLHPKFFGLSALCWLANNAFLGCALGLLWAKTTWSGYGCFIVGSHLFLVPEFSVEVFPSSFQPNESVLSCLFPRCSIRAWLVGWTGG